MTQVPIIGCIKPFLIFRPPSFIPPRIQSPITKPFRCKITFGEGRFYGGQTVFRVENPIENAVIFYDTEERETGSEA